MSQGLRFSISDVTTPLLLLLLIRFYAKIHFGSENKVLGNVCFLPGSPEFDKLVDDWLNIVGVIDFRFVPYPYDVGSALRFVYHLSLSR